LAFAVNLLTSLIARSRSRVTFSSIPPLQARDLAEHGSGAIPGALPPVMGWTAARNELTGEGWALFAILFFWQNPAFPGHRWMYREEYGASRLRDAAVGGSGRLPHRPAGGQPHAGPDEQ